ncbi:MAG: vWA domain-containing protein [Geminicoccaceae bacterium]
MGRNWTTTQFLIAAFLAGSTSLSPVSAESNRADAAKAILVLDGSGSMWGRINDTPKISIAQDVIRGLLDDWDPSVELGVSVYGHREKGNCGDIEMLVPIGPVDREGVMASIGDLNPKGKTPLTDAVRQAAEALKHTEERATVILVSDGKETCEADPCAAAEELEASGVDFTVHVVGFDLDAEEKAQLQCMADNTGGKFLSADSASELHEAMATTVQLVAEPEPAPKRVIKLEAAPVGTLKVENVTGDHVYVYEPGNSYQDDIDLFIANDEKTVQLKAGRYLLGTSDQDLAEVEIQPGEDVVVDMKDHFGWLTIENVAGDHVYVYEPGNSYQDDIDVFIANDEKTAQLKAGTYVLGTSEQELTTFEIAPGEEVVIDLGG